MPLVSKNFSDIITFTRASTGTFFDSAGVLTSANSDIPRFDFNPSTLAAQGFLVEEARTNSIRNNTMVGAVAGTPGTLPTNWTVTPATGLAANIAAIGTENGINYVDIQFVGTASATSQCFISAESTTQIVAASGQSWTGSYYLALTSGSIIAAGITGARIDITGRTAAGSTLENTQLNYTPVSGVLSQNRVSVSRTLTDVNSVRVNSAFRVDVANGTSVDFTLRIGLPQLELGAFATSVIPTTTTALTRSADVASVNTLSPWFNASEGTLYGEVSSAAQTVGGVSRRIANINDGTEADRITVGWAGATAVGAAFVTDNSVTQAGFNSPSGAYPFPTKVALAYKAADFQAAVNGSAFATVSSGTVPTVTQMRIGDVVTGGTGPQNLNGHVRRISYFPRRLSQAELTAITA